MSVYYGPFPAWRRVLKINSSDWFQRSSPRPRIYISWCGVLSGAQLDEIWMLNIYTVLKINSCVKYSLSYCLPYAIPKCCYAKDAEHGVLDAIISPTATQAIVRSDPFVSVYIYIYIYIYIWYIYIYIFLYIYKHIYTYTNMAFASKFVYITWNSWFFLWWWFFCRENWCRYIGWEAPWWYCSILEEITKCTTPVC